MMWDMTQFGSLMAGVMFVWAIIQQWFPEELGNLFQNYLGRLGSYMYPYITISFYEYQEDEYERSTAYTAIERYLSTNSSNGVKRLKANVVKNNKSIFLSMDDNEEVIDEYKGMRMWWKSCKIVPQQRALISYSEGTDEKRYYKLTCHRKNRDIVTKVYMPHVLDEGEEIAKKTRQRYLYTNGKSTRWSHIIFEHPSTFDTLAMHPEKKTDILNDLATFIKSKDYYQKVGKSWKRGYLLYGPPGTGKSSMIAAMANLLDYDIYDLELTSVKDNTDLRKLLIRTSSKSIIVIEDIDCSLDLTGQRKKKGGNTGEEKNLVQKKEHKKKKRNEVTLSGLLNSIDGLWSACGSERLIVFTTNHVEKLDPALIRRGRMDKHIELSYCCFETFKVLANNYLDLESHELFPHINRLLEETNMTPADVAEHLMPKSSEENAESCLNDLIKALENAKEAKLKAAEEARIEDEEEAAKKSEQNSENAPVTDPESTDKKSSDGESSDEDSSD